MEAFSSSPLVPGAFVRAPLFVEAFLDSWLSVLTLVLTHPSLLLGHITVHTHFSLASGLYHSLLLRRFRASSSSSFRFKFVPASQLQSAGAVAVAVKYDVDSVLVLVLRLYMLSLIIIDGSTVSSSFVLPCSFVR